MTKTTALKNYQDDYEQSLNTLEDIQRLSEYSLAPLVSRVYYHLSEIKRKADSTQLNLVNPYEIVNKVLDEKFESILADFFNNNSKCKNYTFEKKTERLVLDKWNLILEIIPEFLSVVSLFNFLGEVNVKLDHKKILISGNVLEDGQLELGRTFIYQMTRKLLKHKVLMTYSLKKSDKSGLNRLELIADISFDNSAHYNVKFSPNPARNYLVGFSNIFSNYSLSTEEIESLETHNIIELGNDLAVTHKFGKIDSNHLKLSNKELLHFSFIFRPVSIILPMRGVLSKSSSIRSLDNREQDVSNQFHIIDFFSLFNL
jgi:hypothetical protein